nr:putative tetrameric tRNA splicing endonuclease [Cryptomonas curvata]
MKTIRIITSGHNNFFLNNLLSILILRSEFRIYGNLVVFYLSNILKKVYFFLSLEEVLLGIELGFLSLYTLIYNYKTEPCFVYLKYFFKNIKNLKKKNINYTETKSEILIKLWRESIILVSSIFKKNRKNCIKKKQSCLCNLNKKNKKIFLMNFISELKQKSFVKFKIFRDLWQRGLIITCGIKFGASYIIYAGEISFVHASSSIIILEKSDNIYSHDLVPFGRIGTSTQKRCLLAYIKRNLSVNYIGLKWNNNLP